ncbi:hypothetical protein [Melghirimyces algeriensis]|uniref:Uncharacterized protein n=1 Tax=Melghirimyces algeriensis TaxID=910412 RepID=A0A521BNG6_9BACL|nr:hypothetical protein [Melghirimyces algeriensis]SMO48688.1 hypothetical protein SAMN06264849_102242 [Melghirimyces algeriensis]
MPKTPYRDLESEDILSAHLSGLQHSVNKMEEVLNMQTRSVTGHPLKPVNDQEDAGMRYRIYEGSIRNWLEDPAPVIYRNGLKLDPAAYTISPAHGVILFDEPQHANDEFTADFTCIDARSLVLEASQGIHLPLQQAGLLTHLREGTPSLVSASNVLVNENTLDLFPLMIRQRTVITEAGVRLGKYTTADILVRVALYQDTGGAYPGELLAESPEIAYHGTEGDEPHEWKFVELNLTLEPGLYWLARFNDAASQWDGLDAESAMVYASEVQDNLSLVHYGGLRTTDRLYSDGFPAVFPEGVQPFMRSVYASPFLRKA